LSAQGSQYVVDMFANERVVHDRSSILSDDLLCFVHLSTLVSRDQSCHSLDLAIVFVPVVDVVQVHTAIHTAMLTASFLVSRTDRPHYP
jgi:hypothetical protein